MKQWFVIMASVFSLVIGCAKNTTQPAPAAPAAPAMVSVTAGGNSVAVAWDTVMGATRYNLYYKQGTTVDTVSGTKLAGVTSPDTVTGLTGGTQYAFGVSAVNAGGESSLSGVQTATPELADIDGNVYHTVTIGTQVWMAENLKTTKFNDGTTIPLVTVDTDWAALTTPGYCWYNDSVSYEATYGALYNWYVVNTGKLAPKGWHVPTDSEWTVLTTFLGGTTVAGGKLKETGTAHWDTLVGATDEYGFTALPGGCRIFLGSFYYIGSLCYWWSATVYNATSAWDRALVSDNTYVGVYINDYQYGLSVRCVRDN